MEKMKESIIYLQASLNQLLQTEESVSASGVYLLSVMLDKEIVKYYKCINQHE